MFRILKILFENDGDCIMMRRLQIVCMLQMVRIVYMDFDLRVVTPTSHGNRAECIRFASKQGKDPNSWFERYDVRSCEENMVDCYISPNVLLEWTQYPGLRFMGRFECVWSSFTIFEGW